MRKENSMKRSIMLRQVIERLQHDGSVTPTDAKVDLKTGGYDTTKGNKEFLVTWSDPDFKAIKLAFYYVRVLQLPTARWNALG